MKNEALRYIGGQACAGEPAVSMRILQELKC